MNQTRLRTALPIGAILLALGLAGCAPETPAPTPSASATEPVAAVATCDDLLPAETAAAVLGIPSADLVAQTLDIWKADDTGGAGIAALSAAALVASGITDCRWTVEQSNERAPFVHVAVLPAAASEFRAVEPDVNDGVGAFEPVAVGDEAYITCHGGEGAGCRIEALVGENWMSISVSPKFDDPSIITDLASSLVPLVKTMPAGTKSAPAIDCATALSTDAVSAAGVVDPTLHSDDPLGERDSIITVAQRFAGLASCGWMPADTTQPGGVSLTALPAAANPEPGSPIGGSRSTIATEAVPSLGEAAVGGCDDYTCELLVLTPSTWLRLSTNPATTSLDQLIALAQGAVANLR